MPPKPVPQWPPRSPHEALLSSPSGRDRLRRIAERTSPSPSPSKRAPRSASRAPGADDTMALDLDGDDDDDEELLELKLAAIKAKLKLKKLQSAKAKGTQNPSPNVSDIAPPARSQSQAAGTSARPQSQVDIQVPASPVRRAQTSQETTSPSRVRLGIDKGLRAKDVSLKRAPSSRKTSETTTSTATGSLRSNFLQRARTPASEMPDQSRAQERPKSFSERLAAARTEEVTKQERQERIKQVRTNNFQLGKDEMEDLKQKATDIPDIPIKEEQYSREDVMAGTGLKRSNTLPSMKSQEHDSDGDYQAPLARIAKKKVPASEVSEEEASAFEPFSNVHLSKRIIPHTSLTRNLSGKKTYLLPDLLKHVKAPEYQLPDIEQDIVVFGILASKSEPKTHNRPASNVREKADTENQPARAKYMVLTLTDLKWELELFLFGSGFDRFYRLTTGTLLAVLNPIIMPPPPHRTDTGRFSLVINSDADTILEIGNARDLGYCKSIKKDGQPCASWVNVKRTEFCEFHMNLALDRKRLARQEVNAFDMGLGPNNKKHINSRRLPKWEEHANDPGKKRRGNFDRDTQTPFFMHKASASSMLDNEVLGGEHGRAASTIERSEVLRRRLATEEKERDLMKKLGEVGSGAGKDYMLKEQQRKTGQHQPPSSGTSSLAGNGIDQHQSQPKPDAKSLGLVGVNSRSKTIHLSPVKRKRVESALSSRSSSSSLPFSSSSTTTAPTAESASSTTPKPALGWGGGLKDKLARMKDGEKLRVDSSASIERYFETGNTQEEADKGIARVTSPARKKTRFITEKGIREAGRESLGDELITAGGKGKGLLQGGNRMVVLDDDDDEEDELVILPP